MCIKIRENVLDNSLIFKLKQRINICNKLTQHSKELIAMNKIILTTKGELLNEQNSNYRIKEP